MAEADATNTCCLRWRIQEPFAAWRRFEAIFYHGSGSPSLTEWKVSIDPLLPPANYRYPFRFAIKCLQPEGSEKIIAVERMGIKISLRGRFPMDKKFHLHNYSFSKENQHSYVFEWTVLNFPIPTEVRLKIKVHLTFPNSNINPPEENGLVYRHSDLTELSRDLGRQERNLRYCNLTMKSNQLDEFKFHSCMLRARWSNFFTKHPENSIANGTIETIYSKELLSDIRNYIYSGKGGKGIINSRDSYALSVLFGRIDEYRLHHLYKSFVKDDSQQERTTSTYEKKRSVEMELDKPLNGPPIMRPTFRWDIERDNPAFKFILVIRFDFNRDPPSFSYRLRSRSPRRMFTELSVEWVERRIEYPRNQEFKSLYRGTHVFEPSEDLDDGPLEFGRQDPILNRYIESSNLRPEQRTCRYAIRCILYMSTGHGKTKISCLFQDDMEMLNVLSHHMSELLTNGYDHDFKVVCRSENVGEETHLLHKAIFSTRVPNYWAVLEGVEKQSDIPDEARCILSNEAFRYVVQYIYTGKVCPIPNQHLDEIENFADKGEFNSLKTLVDKIRTDAKDR